MGGREDRSDPRRVAEELTATAHQRLLEAIDCLPAGFALYDAADRLVLCNEWFRRIYHGYEDLLIPGVPFERELRESTYRGQVAGYAGREEEWIARRLAYHRDPRGALEVELADGRWTEIHERRTAEGGVIGVRVDITARKRAEQALRERGAELEAIYRALPDLCFRVAADGTILDYKPGTELEPYLAPERFLGQPMSEVLSEPAATICSALIERTAAGGALERAEYPLPFPDGDHHFEARAVPLEAGEVFVLVREIPDRVRAAAELHASEARFRDFAETAADWFYETDGELRFRYLSPGFETVTGTPSERILGRTCKEALREHVAGGGAGLEAHFAEVCARRPFRDLEFQWLGADGEPRVLRTSARPVHGASGEFLGYRGTVSDVTEQHRLERQLVEAAKMESLGQLAGGIAHDFNNLLGSILGYTGLALRRHGTGMEPSLRRYLEEVRRAGERARDIVARVLDFARGEPGEQRTLATGALLGEIAGLLSSTLPKTLAVSAECTPGVPAVRVDRVQIEQVLLNLAVNARDATRGAGSLRLHAGLAAAARRRCVSCGAGFDGEWVSIAISDQGEGIAEADLARIFEPFFSTKEVGRGTGLGLAITHGIVHGHGGHLGIESSPGAGTTVTVYLPVGHGPQEPAPTPARPLHGGGAGLAGARVLVVDDEVALTGVLAELLGTEGCEVTIETDPLAARRRLEGHGAPFALLITDQVMPGLTGIELAAAARARHPQTACLMCTGHPDSVDRAAAAAAGVDALLLKPVEPGALLAEAARLLGARR